MLGTALARGIGGRGAAAHNAGREHYPWRRAVQPLKEWARDAVARLLRETALKLAAVRERERVEAERWLAKLRAQARERADKDKPG